MQATATRTAAPGIARFLHPFVLGDVIAMAGASAFVLVNRDALPDPWRDASLIAWVAGLGACIWFALLRPRILPDPGPPHRFAGPIYLASVVGMIVMMAGGGWVVRTAGLPHLQPAVVVTAVGLHFIPFAWVFGARVFAIVGGALSVVGICAVGLGLMAGPVPVAAGAVTAGLLMLAFRVGDAVRLQQEDR